MREDCKTCKLGSNMMPDGKHPPFGTVYCLKRKLEMGDSRPMTCFTPAGGMERGRCFECKFSKTVKSLGGTPAIGNVWCEKTHKEMSKSLTMGCFERR